MNKIRINRANKPNSAIFVLNYHS